MENFKRLSAGKATIPC